MTLHLTIEEAPAVEDTDLFGLNRGYLFGWDEDHMAHAVAFGEALAECGLTAPLMMGAIGGVGHMLAAYWEAEENQPRHAAYARADQYAEIAKAAAFDALDAFLAAGLH